MLSAGTRWAYRWPLDSVLVAPRSIPPNKVPLPTEPIKPTPSHPHRNSPPNAILQFPKHPHGSTPPSTCSNSVYTSIILCLRHLVSDRCFGRDVAAKSERALVERCDSHLILHHVRVPDMACWLAKRRHRSRGGSVTLAAAFLGGG